MPVKTTEDSTQVNTPGGVELRGEVTPAFAQILMPDALAFVAKLERQFGARRLECLQRRKERQTALDRGEALDFPARNKRDPRKRLDMRADSARHARSSGRDHRSDRSQDGDQRAQFRRENVHGRFRGCQLADLGNMVEGQINLRDAIRRTIISRARKGKNIG